MRIATIHKLKMSYQNKIKGINWLLNRFTERIENVIIQHNRIRKSALLNKSEPQIIVSLTTYPARLKKVQWTIKSLLNQDQSFDKMIVWIADSQFSNKEIPNELAQYAKYGVEIKFCEDIRSHKKYYYVMQQYPNSIIITVDDDVIYPEDTITKLVEKHIEYPKCVICNQARWIKKTKNGLDSYNKWIVAIPQSCSSPSYNILPIGEGGILYPPNSVNREVFDLELLKQTAWTADDLWLKTHELRNRTKAVITKIKQKSPSPVIVLHEPNDSLNSINVLGGKNDEVINKLIAIYPDILELID